MAPRDPILGLNEQFNADPHPAKINLGVGVYTDENGKLPLLRCVRAAEETMAKAPATRGYLPIDGIVAYDSVTQALVFGEDHPARTAGRIATVQTVGGTGALKVGADLLKRMSPGKRVLISDPSWENHRALFENAGFEVATYPYYDAARHDVAFDAMLSGLDAAEPGTVVVLHACCHNPTGCDLTTEQWKEVVAVVAKRRLVPFLDLAYQGFGDGIAEDGQAVLLFVEAGLDCLVATSFSKSFSLYGERVGALSVVCFTADEAARVLSQLKRVIRTNYSNPPTHGRGHRRPCAVDARAALALGGRTRRHARTHQTHAGGIAAQAAGRGRPPRHRLHHPAARHVQLLGPFASADATPAQRVQRLRCRFRPHMRGCAERWKPRHCRRCDRSRVLRA